MALVMYHGLQGSGKTYGMVHDLLVKFAKRPVQVYTNISSMCVPEAVYFHNIDQLFEVSNGLILLDEVGIVLPAQHWHEVSREFLVRLCQLRHDGLDMWYTVQRRDGANVNMREQTGRFVCCTRVGPFIWRKTDHGEKSVNLGSQFIRLKPQLFGLYDTHTNIGIGGGSMERRQAPVTSLAVRRVAAAARGGQERRRSRPERSLLRYDLFDGLLGGPMTTRPTREVRDVYEWLVDGGHMLGGVHWAAQVRAEIDRRAWLKLFSLGPDDAPITCRPECPWLDGYDPKTVKRKWDAEQAEIMAEKLAIQKVRTRKQSA